MKGRVEYIDSKTASEFLLPKHYSGRTPSISQAFGWYFGNELKAVCTFGKPASPAPCKGVCGEKWANNVYELNRLCRTEDLKEPLSQFVSACLRRLRANNWIVISYSDTGMNHHGYIYQACNFIYTGCTTERKDRYTGDKHARHYAKYEDNGLRQIRTSKHRYVYFCTFNSKLKKQWQSDLKWGIEPYPKGDNSNYTLGEYQKPIVVDKDNNRLQEDEIEDILNKVNVNEDDTFSKCYKTSGYICSCMYVAMTNKDEESRDFFARYLLNDGMSKHQIMEELKQMNKENLPKLEEVMEFYNSIKNKEAV